MSSNTSKGVSGGSGKGKRRPADQDEEISHKVNADDDALPQKRQRVSRACDSCRSKKDKCDGVQPICSTCAALCRPCTYKANPKKRGLPTGYIRTLELLWGLVFNKVRGSENVVRALLRAENIPAHLATWGKEGEGSDLVVSTWKNSTVLRDIERVLASLDPPDDEENRTIPIRDSEITRDFDPSNLPSLDALQWQLPEELLDINNGLASTEFSPARTSTAVPNVALPRAVNVNCGVQTDLLTPDQVNLNANPEGPAQASLLPVALGQPLQLPTDALSLIQIYFSYTHCWLPILEKHNLLRTAYHYADEDVYISSSLGSGDHATLWAVLALATIQETSILMADENVARRLDRRDAERLYATSRSFIPLDGCNFEVGHAQALLILALVNLGQQKWTSAWMLIGHAIRIARSLGLDNFLISQRTSPQNPVVFGRGKHVYLGCFVLETLLAMRISRLPSLRKEDLAQAGSVNEDGLEEWHPWEDRTESRSSSTSRTSLHRGPLRALSTFNRLVTLVSIANEYCWATFDPSRLSSSPESQELQLQLWMRALPKSYRADIQASSAGLAAPHIFGLEMIYESLSSAINIRATNLRWSSDLADTHQHRERAAEGSKRLLRLLQLYIATYGMSATFPTFGMILQICVPGCCGQDANPPSLDLDTATTENILSLSGRFCGIWSMSDGPATSSGHGRFNTAADSGMTSRLVHPSTSFGSETALPANPAMRNRGGQFATSTSVSKDCVFPELREDMANPNTFLVNSWMGEGQDMNPSASITTLREHDPALAAIGGAHQAQSSVSFAQQKGKELPGLQPLSSQFQPSNVQNVRVYHDTNPNLDSFLQVDRYGSTRQDPQIAPDLDALFDDLASLDGTERYNNQPEFMQNLGFITESGIPEFYSWPNEIEPFLLAQSHQALAIESPSLIRRQSQQTAGS